MTTVPGKLIWIVSINTVETIHAQALGFTKQFYAYALARTAGEAADLCLKWYDGEIGIKCHPIEECACRMAANQDLGSYTFPHQIINIPEAMLTEIYDQRGYPASHRTEAFRV